jgi:translation initiation factor eIF-2B subunit beta
MTKIEGMTFFADFKRKLRKKNYINSTFVAKETAEKMKETIIILFDKKAINNLDDLITAIKYLGNIIITIDPVQFCTGNIIKQILNFIREEKDKCLSEKNEDFHTEEVKDAEKTLKLLKDFDFKDIKDGKNETKGNNKIESADSLSEAKNKILTEMDNLINEIDNISTVITGMKELNDLIIDGDTILTSHNSEQVREILIASHKKNKKFKVFVAESAPLYSGRVQAEKLIENGIDVTVINDDDIYSVMTEFNKMKVLIGARAILVNGAAITYNGAYNICLSANMFFIPVIIAGGVTKLTPMYSFNHELYNEYLSPSLIYNKNVKYEGDITGLKFNTPAFDYVPQNLITMYAMDIGIILPICIYREFPERYSQDDFEI